MPVRICLACGADVQRGERCQVCEAKRERDTPGRHGQQAFRRRTLALTGGQCAGCGSRRNVMAHHVRPVRDGGADAPVGVPLCASCHGRQDAAARRSS